MTGRPSDFGETPFPPKSPSGSTYRIAEELGARMTVSGKIFVAPNQLRKGDLTKHWEVKDEPHVFGNQHIVFAEGYKYTTFGRIAPQYRFWGLEKASEKTIQVLYLEKRR